MMKKVLLALLMLGSIYAKGQEKQSRYKNYAWEQVNKPAFSIGPEIYLPLKSPVNFGYGLSVKGEQPITEDLSITATGGFVHYNFHKFFKEIPQAYSSSNFVPVKAGAKYFLGNFYFEAEPGAVVQLDAQKKILFAIGLGTGFMVPISERHSIDVQARYENWGAGNYRQTVVRIAYRADWF